MRMDAVESNARIGHFYVSIFGAVYARLNVSDSAYYLDTASLNDEFTN